MGNGSGAKMMQNRKMPIHQFDNTGDATAFKTAVDAAITAKDYTAFKAAHTKYSIEFDMSEEDFVAMITRRAEAKTRQAEHEALREQSQTALENNDYATWAKLNKDTPIGKLITTQAKFTQLQEMHSYQQKAKTIRESLGLP
jgi:hypothetical protein